MRPIASTLMMFSLLACATTAHRVPMTDPKTGEIVRDSKGDIVLAKEDEHNYADPLGRGQRDAADADLTKAKADAVRDFGQVCLERNRIMGRNPADFLGQSFQCEPGHIMATEGGWMAYPMGAPSYMIPYGGPAQMNGGYNQPFYDNGPTSQLIENPRNLQPFSGVYSGPPRIVRIPVSTGHAGLQSQLDPTKPEPGKGQGGGDRSEKRAKPLLSQKELEDGERLEKEAAMCTADPILAGTDECRLKVEELRIYQDSLADLARNRKNSELAMSGKRPEVRVTGGGGDGGSGENKSMPEQNMSVNPGNGIWTPADTSPPANRITQ